MYIYGIKARVFLLLGSYHYHSLRYIVGISENSELVIPNLWMVSSRHSLEGHEGDGGKGYRISVMQSKQKHGDPKQASLRSGLRNMMKGHWTNDCELYFERFFRRVVQEEVEGKIQDILSSRAWVNQTSTPRETTFELRFINKLADIIFTHSNVIAEDRTSIRIALFDVRDQSVVNVGPLSSIKVEICALNGEFGFNGSEDWTEAEFNANILRERDGRRPLLNGDRFINLKNGVGCVNKVMFTDNSKWVRSRKFRLGAKVVANETNIKEGRTEPFVVKDCRGEAYKKHYPPSLNDDVWRLDQIAKDKKIHERLSLHGIHTVKDLLRLYTTNPSSLLEKVGKITKRSWMRIIEHAKTCVIDDNETFVYYSAEQLIGLLFNSIYVLVGVTFDGQNYRSPDTLTTNEKHLVEILKQDAYKNTDNFKSIHDTSLNCSRPLAYLVAPQSDATEQVLQQFNISAEQEDHQGTCSGNGQPYASTSCIDEAVHSYQIHVDPVLDITDMPLNNHPYGNNSMKDFFSGLCIEGDIDGSLMDNI